MTRKRNRTKRQKTGDATPGGTPRSKKKKKRGLSGTSLAFIGLILLAAAAIGIAMAFGERPDCPQGQVWSEAHGHCH